MKAVVVDIQGRSAAAMNENGEIIRINNDNFEIGQSIEIKETKAGNKCSSISKRMKKLSSIAAAVAVLTAAGSATAYALPYGTVSLDTEPAVEYTINCFDYVLDVNVNDDSESAISSSDLSVLKNQKISDAVKATIEKMEVSSGSGSETTVNIEAETKNGAHTDKLKRDIELTLINENMIEEQAEIPEYIYKNGLQGPAVEDIQNGDILPQQEEAPELHSDGIREEIAPGNDIPTEPMGGGQPEGSGPENNEEGGVPFLIHE